MDAFEQVVSEILWMSGFWVRTSVKVDLTKEEKRLIGRHSSPRWELDIVGYSGRENLLRVVECKSFLDSTGVKACAFDGSDPEEAKRYKRFNEPELRRIVKGTRRVHEKTHACNSFQIKKKEWCRRGESNPRPRDYETLALPLSYAGIGQFSMLRSNARECQAQVRRQRR
jgi:hypothetical protein